jgi:hypothetical protein
VTNLLCQICQSNLEFPTQENQEAGHQQRLFEQDHGLRAPLPSSGQFFVRSAYVLVQQTPLNMQTELADSNLQ